MFSRCLADLAKQTLEFSEDFSLLVTFLLVTSLWLFRGPHLPRKTVFAAISWFSHGFFRGLSKKSKFGCVRGMSCIYKVEKWDVAKRVISFMGREVQGGSKSIMKAVKWLVAKLQGDEAASFCRKMSGREVTGRQISVPVFHGTLLPMEFWTPSASPEKD